MNQWYFSRTLWITSTRSNVFLPILFMSSSLFTLCLFCISFVFRVRVRRD